jgi:hypothetical protein
MPNSIIERLSFNSLSQEFEIMFADVRAGRISFAFLIANVGNRPGTTSFPFAIFFEVAPGSFP